MHLVRLLKMGVEVLTEGTLVVRRPDAEELLAIRAGSLDYERLKDLQGRLVAALEAALLTTSLPDQPDQAVAEELVIRLHLAALGAPRDPR